VNSFELLKYYRGALKAEGAPFKRKFIVFTLLVIGLIFNLISIGVIYKKISSIMQTHFLLQESDIIGGCSIIDKLSNRGYIYFGGFYISKEFQNRGYGNLVMKTIIDRYSQNELVLDASIDNEAALHLYRKFGFVNLEEGPYSSSDNEIRMIRKITGKSKDLENNP